jgi:hypothetical protein
MAAQPHFFISLRTKRAGHQYKYRINSKTIDYEIKTVNYRLKAFIILNLYLT